MFFQVKAFYPLSTFHFLPILPESQIQYPGNSCKIGKSQFNRGIAMIKYDLARAVQEKAGLSLAEATDAVKLVIATLKETLGEGETVKFSGFGTFLVKKRGERKGRDLKTGEEIPVKSKWVVTFKASEQFNVMVNDEQGGV